MWTIYRHIKLNWRIFVQIFAISLQNNIYYIENKVKLFTFQGNSHEFTMSDAKFTIPFFCVYFNSHNWKDFNFYASNIPNGLTFCTIYLLLL